MLRARLLLASLALCALASTASAQTTYRLQPVNFGGTQVNIYPGLNDRGEVVGTRTMNGVRQTVVWRDRQVTVIPLAVNGQVLSPGWLALNNHSAILVTSNIELFSGTFRTRSFIWRAGQLTDLGQMPGSGLANTRGLVINDLGQVVGISDSVSGTNRSIFTWQSGTMIRLCGAPEGGSPRAINNRGEVIIDVGLLRGGEFIRAAPPPGAAGTQMEDVNNFGQTVGLVHYDDGRHRAFFWQEGRTTVLPRVAGGDIVDDVALSLNDREWVVGASYCPRLGHHAAVLWRDGGVYNLNTLIRAGDPLKPIVSLTVARSINNAGQILVSGTDVRTGWQGGTYLLVPSP